MRLIDANKINFEKVFGGQSDFAKDIRDSAQRLINNQPTAFDKEKVIAELNSGRFVTVDGITVGESTIIRIDRAVEIIEKGGIE